MEPGIKDLVSMNDSASLFEIMNDTEDDFIPLDAAEGLVMLGDRRGLDFLNTARDSPDRDIREYAQEILASPEVKQILESIAADQEKKHQSSLLEAEKRLIEGKKVFAYKVIAVTAEDLVDGEQPGSEFKVRRLEDAGLLGWEVVGFFNPGSDMFTLAPGTRPTGAYLLMKKELFAKDHAELNKGR